MGRILLDCDGVLGDFTGTLLMQLNEKLGTDYTRDRVRQFDMRTWLDDDAFATAQDILNAPGFARSLDPIEGAIASVLTLRAFGHEVYVVTSPFVTNPTWEHDRRRWLDVAFGIDEDHIISTTAKHLVAGDVFVDDRPKHVRRWSAERGKPAFLFRQEHNCGSLSDRASDLRAVPGQAGYVWTKGMVAALVEVVKK